jgi:FKBP-type peptidyl-prolyl cis-trans isomerase
MREGEWRELIVPSDWAYRNGALVYLVELRKVK